MMNHRTRDGLRVKVAGLEEFESAGSNARQWPASLLHGKLEYGSSLNSQAIKEEAMMPPDMMKNRVAPDESNMKRESSDNPRALTHDEKKAAEAAFRGAPFNPEWSSSAARVYAGIVSAMSSTQTAAFEDSDVATECFAGR